MGSVRIVDQSGTCHDEASPWSVGSRNGDQVFRAIEIGSPDVILILSPENRGKMNDCRNALDGLLQRIRIEKIAFHRRGSSGNFAAIFFVRRSTQTLTRSGAWQMEFSSNSVLPDSRISYCAVNSGSGNHNSACYS